MEKPTICIGENKGADQLRGNLELPLLGLYDTSATDKQRICVFTQLKCLKTQLRFTGLAENKILFVCPLPTYPQFIPTQKIILHFLEEKYFYFSMAE